MPRLCNGRNSIPHPVDPTGSASHIHVTVDFNRQRQLMHFTSERDNALPAGATASFSPSSVTSTGLTASTLTISTTNATPPGSTTSRFLPPTAEAHAKVGLRRERHMVVVAYTTPR